MADTLFREEEPGILVAFTAEYLRDRRKGRVRSAAEYQDLFPGFEALIARELAVLERDEPEHDGDAPERHEAVFPASLVHASPTDERAPSKKPPVERIGPYKMLSVLGEGGMGVVCLAEQAEPVKRRVAVKLIRPGLQTESVLARFESERQALALLNHDVIAKVFDAGETEDGRPYFVMEPCHGFPITEYCDRHRLTLDARLELFRRVCAGIHHAHLKGIVHRDLKPSNILVASSDNEPAVKVIDFGVAKSTQQRLTERTLYTEFGQVVGTPTFMSPEQAESGGEEVDHLTDIYSLGVLLYVLLVGETPHDPDVLRKAAVDEMLRIIRDEEPPTPSRRWSSLNRKRTESVADRRDTRPEALGEILRSDLGWIVMKALDRDRARRYGSAAELSADINRYREHRPVLAGPPTTGYRVAKFVKRHRTAVLWASTVLTILLIAIATTSVVAIKSSTRLDRLLRLSDFRRIEELRERAEKLGPAEHDRIETFESWIVEARDLLDRLDLHAADLAELAAAGRPLDHASLHPRFHEIADLEAERRETRDKLEEARERDAGLIRTRIPFGGPSADEKSPTAYFRGRFAATAGTGSSLEIRLLVNDGAVVRLNGQEILRRRMPEGPISHFTLADELVRPPSPDAPMKLRKVDLPEPEAAAALLSGDSVLDVEVHQVSRASDDLVFDLELVLLKADGSSDLLIPSRSTWWYNPGGGVPLSVPRVPSAEQWPTGRAPLGYTATDELEGELLRIAEEIEQIDREIDAARVFDEPTDQWWHDQLARLVREMKTFDTLDVERVRPRLALARQVRAKTIDSRRGDWSRVIEEIVHSPVYDGLQIVPQEGLAPLGADPDSDLQEFGHLETGEIPSRDANGKLTLTTEHGLIFVLVPGGIFSMGCEPPSATRGEHDANTDKDARADEGPVRDVTLAPFFLSKFEMTQAQWERVTGSNPNAYGPGRTLVGKQTSRLHPVENVNWTVATRILAQLGLELPTEAMWEYAARAGTTTVWFTGNDMASLEGFANLADESWKRAKGTLRPTNLTWDDGHAIHAPVGSYRPNLFGFHDIAGNVFEWCRDTYGSLEIPVAGGSGERLVSPTGSHDVVRRGGSFYWGCERGRSGHRSAVGKGFASGSEGLRPARLLRGGP